MPTFGLQDAPANPEGKCQDFRQGPCSICAKCCRMSKFGAAWRKKCQGQRAKPNQVIPLFSMERLRDVPQIVWHASKQILERATFGQSRPPDILCIQEASSSFTTNEHRAFQTHLVKHGYSTYWAPGNSITVRAAQVKPSDQSEDFSQLSILTSAARSYNNSPTMMTHVSASTW